MNAPQHTSRDVPRTIPRRTALNGSVDLVMKAEAELSPYQQALMRVNEAARSFFGDDPYDIVELDVAEERSMSHAGETLVVSYSANYRVVAAL